MTGMLTDVKMELCSHKVNHCHYLYENLRGFDLFAGVGGKEKILQSLEERQRTFPNDVLFF